MNLVKTAAIASGQTQAVIPVGDMNLPGIATLTSAAGGRQIEASTTGDQSAGSWFVLTNNASTASMINATIAPGVTHIRFTGVAADVCRVQ